MARNQSLHNERQSLLRRAHGHYGNTLRDEEAGTASSATSRPAGSANSARACNGERSQLKAHAGHEDGILRALLHFDGEMSGELAQHIHSRLAALKAEFLPDLKPEPLKCHVVKGGGRTTRPDRLRPANARASAATPTRGNAGSSVESASRTAKVVSVSDRQFTTAASAFMSARPPHTP